MNQPSLFDEATPLARRTDPATSREAAQFIAPQVGELQKWAVDCVTKTPGKTQRELGVLYCPEDLRKIGRRLGECVKLGLLRRGASRACTISGRQAETWYPITPQGE